MRGHRIPRPRFHPALILLLLLLCLILCACGGGRAQIEAPSGSPAPVTAGETMAESPAPFGDFNPGSIPLRREEGSHEAFLPLDGEGRFFPDETLSRAQVLELVFWCLDPDWELEGRPLSQWTAKEALASLGLTKPLSSQTSVVTRYEFYAMLELLCGSLEVDAQFEDVLPESSLYPTFQTAVGSGWLADGPDVYAYPNKALTRRDAARALNQVLGRRGDDKQRLDLVGAILDVSVGDPDFWAIAEASVSHEFEPSEHWLSSSPAPVRQPGFFFLDGRLHAIDEQGAPVVGKEYAGIRFNAAGEQTSGDAELDELVRDTLVQIVDFETMSREGMLKAAFDYVSDPYNFGYRGRGHYERGSSGWEIEAASVMFRTEHGNCYNYAAAFWALAKALGYDATAISGSIAGREAQDQRERETGVPHVDQRDHSWVEIVVDGESRIFDVEMAFSYSDPDGFFNAGEEIRARYKYQIGEEP